jgi:hypothetical protein
MKTGLLEFKRFDLASVHATPGALAAAQAINGAKTLDIKTDASPVLLPMLLRHRGGDWGDLGAEDKQMNNDATHDGSRVLSAYLMAGFKFYVITDAANDDGKREHTTVLLASEY